MSRVFLGFMTLILAFDTAAGAVSEPFFKTKRQLIDLDKKIHVLKQQLSHVKENHHEIADYLSNQDKKIHDLIQERHQISHQIQSKQTKIEQLSKSLEISVFQLKEREKVLANYVKVRYMMGHDLALKGLFNLDSPEEFHRFAVAYHYITTAHKSMMQNILQTQAELQKNQSLFQKEARVLNELKDKLNQRELVLKTQKEAQLATMHRLSKDIKDKSQVLSEYEKDKENLNRLLQKLLQETDTATTTSPVPVIGVPFTAPVSEVSAPPSVFNQGLLFRAPEGTPVKAVQSGKVVFSDWLRGYGLLMIIEHGHGVMTLYGYNQSLFKRQGERVVSGEKIATVGHSGGRLVDGLYFEVRRYAKVIAAKPFLMKKRG